MATKRVERYKGFTLEITYLPQHPEVEVEATREEYPALAFYYPSIKEAKARIDRYWEDRKSGRSRM